MTTTGSKRSSSGANFYARKFDGMFHREDGGIANIAYVMEKVYNK